MPVTVYRVWTAKVHAGSADARILPGGRLSTWLRASLWACSKIWLTCLVRTTRVAVRTWESLGSGRHLQYPDPVQRFRGPVALQRVSPEPVEVLGLIRAQAGQGRFINFMTFGDQPLQSPGHRHDVVEDQQVRRPMVILDHLPLSIPRVVRQQSTAAEGDPLNKEN
jgi:hypothetical protein